MIYCRNRKCRTKLKKPVSNQREAFCARGCHTSFYLNRCLVCEDPLQRRNKTQKVCRKSQCRNAWRAKAGFGRYLPSTVVSLASKTPDFYWLKTATPAPSSMGAGSWPKIDLLTTAIALWSAPCDAIAEADQKNRPYWRKYFAKALIQPHHPPVNILGGYKFPDAPDVKLREEKEPGFALTASSTKSDDNLDIPDFLKR